MPAHLPVFIVTTWLLAMLPGAGQALMLRQTLGGGRRAAWACIGGNATGLLIWATAAAAGLSAVLLANPAAYRAIRIMGGVVLLVLGVSTLWAARASRTAEPRARRANRWGGYAAGLSTTLGNPKAGVFAVSVLPQFVTAKGPVLLSSIALGLVWALVNTCWYLLFTWGVDRGRALVARPAVQRRLRMITGGVLLLLGVAVAVGV
ncbi:LysE family translocator [Actinoallomurus sp. CA-150999]|uniref:LysE family translocator n=1 Tax=Actinoallomurus sp. CA-150999 TaxID=3239887 RepID=UPI003D8B951B